MGWGAPGVLPGAPTEVTDAGAQRTGCALPPFRLRFAGMSA
ncbi:MAG: hypothetical protein K0S37_2561 [Microbacterium sp.]|jgi:hypothetical protein|nr:hypothetical protein [Microbacterium sp.]